MDEDPLLFRLDYIETPDAMRIRYGWWRTPGISRGLVVFLNGRSEFIEKYWEVVSRLNGGGWDVFSLDWRGQGLSSRWLPNPHKGHVERFDDYLMDLETCMNQVVWREFKGPVVLLAHSMGGHVALRYLHKLFRSATGPDRDYRNRLAGAVLTSPMVGIHTGFLPEGMARLVARAGVAAGLGEAYVPGGGDYDPEKQMFQDNPLTSDPERFQDHVREVQKNPALAVGGVTFGWVRAAFESIDLIRQPGFLDPILCPVILAAAEEDRVVSVEAQRTLWTGFDRGEFLLIKRARHEILKERDEIQAPFWLRFNHFANSI